LEKEDIMGTSAEIIDAVAGNCEVSKAEA